MMAQMSDRARLSSPGTDYVTARRLLWVQGSDNIVDKFNQKKSPLRPFGALVLLQDFAPKTDPDVKNPEWEINF